MSIEALAWVLEHSDAEHGARLVLLALANYAHPDGSNAFPSVASIARLARLSERTTQKALRRLETAGAIERAGKSKHGTIVSGPPTRARPRAPGMLREHDRLAAAPTSREAERDWVAQIEALLAQGDGPAAIVDGLSDEVLRDVTRALIARLAASRPQQDAESGDQSAPAPAARTKQGRSAKWAQVRNIVAAAGDVFAEEVTVGRHTMRLGDPAQTAPRRLCTPQ